VFDDLPRPLTHSAYICDDRFHTEALKELIAPKNCHGLIIIERGEAIIGELRGESVTTLTQLESQVMGKSRAGGQSAQRFARERERQKQEFYHKVAKNANTLLTDPIVDTVSVGGTMITADEFVNTEYLDYRLRDRLIGTFPIHYATSQGLSQLVDIVEESLSDKSEQEARNSTDRFFNGLRDGNVAYGISEIDTALEYGAVATLLVSTSIDQEVRNDLQARTEQQGGEVQLVPDTFERGKQFMGTFDGIGAILRFPIN